MEPVILQRSKSTLLNFKIFETQTLGVDNVEPYQYAKSQCKHKTNFFFEKRVKFLERALFIYLDSYICNFPNLGYNKSWIEILHNW